MEASVLSGFTRTRTASGLPYEKKAHSRSRSAGSGQARSLRGGIGLDLTGIGALLESGHGDFDALWEHEAPFDSVISTPSESDTEHLPISRSDLVGVFDPAPPFGAISLRAWKDGHSSTINDHGYQRDFQESQCAPMWQELFDLPEDWTRSLAASGMNDPKSLPPFPSMGPGSCPPESLPQHFPVVSSEFLLDSGFPPNSSTTTLLKQKSQTFPRFGSKGKKMRHRDGTKTRERSQKDEGFNARTLLSQVPSFPEASLTDLTMQSKRMQSTFIHIGTSSECLLRRARTHSDPRLGPLSCLAWGAQADPPRRWCFCRASEDVPKPARKRPEAFRSPPFRIARQQRSDGRADRNRITLARLRERGGGGLVLARRQSSAGPEWGQGCSNQAVAVAAVTEKDPPSGEGDGPDKNNKSADRVRKAEAGKLSLLF
jgi:hypothetical protein